MPMPIDKPVRVTTEMKTGSLHATFTRESITRHFGDPGRATQLMDIIRNVENGSMSYADASPIVLDLMMSGPMSPMVMQLCFILALPAVVMRGDRTRFVWNLAARCEVLGTDGKMCMRFNATRRNWLSALDALMLWLYDPGDTVLFSETPGDVLDSIMLRIAEMLFSQTACYEEVAKLFDVRAFGETFSNAPGLFFLADNMHAVYGPIHVLMAPKTSPAAFPVVVWGAVQNIKAELQFNVLRWRTNRENGNRWDVRMAALVSLASTSSSRHETVGILSTLIKLGRVSYFIWPLLDPDDYAAGSHSLAEVLADLMMHDHKTMAAVTLRMPWIGVLVPLQFKLQTLAIIRYGFIWPELSPDRADPHAGLDDMEPAMRYLADQIIGWASASTFSNDECSDLLLSAIELYAHWYSLGTEKAVPSRELVLDPLFQLTDKILRETDRLLYDAVSTKAAVLNVDVSWLIDLVRWDEGISDIDYEELLQDFITGLYNTADDSTPEEAIIHTLKQLISAVAPSVLKQ